jgi:nucleotide-binding universal stress UspA family protein
MKILIAYDGSDCSKEALEDLKFAGFPSETKATIITVAETWLPSASNEGESFAELTDNEPKWPWRNKALDVIGESEEFALEAWERLRTIFPDWQVNHETISGSPEWAVVAEAKKLKPDLIVVGSHGRSAAGRMVLGSVSLKVLSESPGSVRIARLTANRAKGDSSPARIIAGVDGSPDSQMAIETIAHRQWQPGAEIRMITAIEPADEKELEARLIKAENLRHAAAEKFEKAGWRVSSVVKPGRAKNLLLEEAEKWNADTIFLGAKGYRFMERILLGSVSYAVTARSHCSVEVVRTEEIPAA